MRYSRAMGSCGVRQIYELPSIPASAVKSVKKKFARDYLGAVYDPCAMVCFSDVTRGSRGTRLADYIAEKKLGPVMASQSVRNPNSGNLITVWIWHVDTNALRRFEVS